MVGVAVTASPVGKNQASCRVPTLAGVMEVWVTKSCSGPLPKLAHFFGPEVADACRGAGARPCGQSHRADRAHGEHGGAECEPGRAHPPSSSVGHLSGPRSPHSPSEGLSGVGKGVGWFGNGQTSTRLGTQMVALVGKAK